MLTLKKLYPSVYDDVKAAKDHAARVKIVSDATATHETPLPMDQLSLMRWTFDYLEQAGLFSMTAGSDLFSLTPVDGGPVFYLPFHDDICVDSAYQLWIKYDKPRLQNVLSAAKFKSRNCTVPILVKSVLNEFALPISVREGQPAALRVSAFVDAATFLSAIEQMVFEYSTMNKCFSVFPSLIDSHHPQKIPSGGVAALYAHRYVHMANFTREDVQGTVYQGEINNSLLPESTEVDSTSLHVHNETVQETLRLISPDIINGTRIVNKYYNQLVVKIFADRQVRVYLRNEAATAFLRELLDRLNRMPPGAATPTRPASPLSRPPSPHTTASPPPSPPPSLVRLAIPVDANNLKRKLSSPEVKSAAKNRWVSDSPTPKRDNAR